VSDASDSPRDILRDVARRLAGRVGRGSLGVVSQNVLNLAAMLYVSRALGAEEYGRLGLALFFSVQAFQFLQWGLQSIVARELVRDPPAAPRMLAAVLRQRTVTAAIVIAAGVLLAAAWGGAEGWLLVWIGIVDGVLLGYTLPAAFDAKFRPGTYALVAHLRPLGLLAGAAALHGLAPEWFGARSVLVIHAAALALSVLVEWALIVRMHGRPRAGGTRGEATRLWREGAPLAAGDLAGSLLGYATIPVVAALGHAAETGHLSLSNQLAVSLTSLAGAPAQALHAHLSSRPDPWSAASRREVLTLTAALVAASVAACTVIALVAPALVSKVFGAEFAPSGRLLQVDAWRLVAVLGGAALASGLTCRGRPGLVAASQALGLVVTLIVAVAAVPGNGALAAVAASSAGRGVALVALLALFLGARRRPA